MMSWVRCSVVVLIGSHLTKESSNGQASLSPDAWVQGNVHHVRRMWRAMIHAARPLRKDERESLGVGGRAEHGLPEREQHRLWVEAKIRGENLSVYTTTRFWRDDLTERTVYRKLHLRDGRGRLHVYHWLKHVDSEKNEFPTRIGLTQ